LTEEIQQAVRAIAPTADVMVHAEPAVDSVKNKDTN
jgi:hypothetical protein